MGRLRVYIDVGSVEGKKEDDIRGGIWLRGDKGERQDGMPGGA